MFLGAAALNLDAKGRLAIPSRHREALAGSSGQVTITAHPHHCLLVYPEAAWSPILEKVRAASSLDPASATLKRLLIGYANPVELDAAGRVLISPEQREYAALDKLVWLVGQGSHFELWSDEGWQKQRERMFALGEQPLPAGFQNLAL